METKQSRLSVLMLPWLAQGHISPFLELAKKLTERNLYVYMCSTPIILSSIKKLIPDKYSPSIKFTEIHLPTFPELPPHYHTTNGLPSHLIPTLQMAFEMASPSLSNILNSLTPDLFINDFQNSWATFVASSCSVPVVTFMTTGATISSFGVHFYKKRSVEFPFPAIQLHGFHLENNSLWLNPPSGESNEKSSLVALQQSSNIMLFNSFTELEGKYIDYLSVLVEKNIYPIGPLVHDKVVDENKYSEIMQWLDKKDESSTVFVSCGSENFPSKEEREELAHGLELSKVNFIWVVRFPVGERKKIEEELPDGFIERISERGLVVEGWAPQARILAHSSTGGFVSHCGWNSILESLKFGVPIIAMPIQLDQPVNARLLVEVGLGVEVERDHNGSVNREQIAQALIKQGCGGEKWGGYKNQSKRN